MTSAPSSPSHADAGPVVDPHQGPDPGPRHHAGRPVRTTRYDPAARPLLVTWEATRACHLACRHCRAEAQPGRDPRELTTDEATALMEQVASFGSPAPIFIITGGDCFERPDLTELVRRGTALGLHVAVAPSATDRVTRDALAELHEAGVNAISLSLDGASPASHDGFRRVEGTFERTLAAWDLAREVGLKVQVNSVVARHNVRELPDIAALVRDHGAMTWSGFLLVPTGRGVDLGPLTADECEDVLNAFYDMGHAVPVKTTEGHHFRRVNLQRWVLDQRGADRDEVRRVMHLGPLYDELTARIAELGLDHGERRRRPPINISSGYGFAFVSHVGDVTPSGFLEIGAGNVRETSVVDLYRSSALFAAVRDRDLLEGDCGVCEYNRVCGGSRSRAYNATGNVHAAEPLCSYRPGTFPYADDVAALIA